MTIEGNTALVKGYALRGTDNVKIQGFKYWKHTGGANAPAYVKNTAANVPGNATTVEATGQIMTANLVDLEFGTTYSYVAFVTTTENETFYGEEQTFTTEVANRVSSLPTNDNRSVRHAVDDRIYDLQGHPVAYPERGKIYIRQGRKYRLR